MKTFPYFLLVLLAVVAPRLHAAGSQRTAEYLLTTPSEFEGKKVTLDVSFVQPVQWKSPHPDLAFFHVVTLDRRNYKPGGRILVVIPSAEASKFAKKYGTNFEGRSESNPFSGVFVAAPGGKKKKSVWLVDSTGKIGDLVKQNKLTIEDEGGEPAGPGPGGPRRPGPR